MSKTFGEWITGVPGVADAEALPVLPSQAPMGRDARNLLAAQQLEQLRILSQTTGALAEQIQGRLVDHVLAVETCVFDPTLIGANYVHRQFKVAVGAVRVRNLSPATAITITQGGPGAAPPTSGRGVYIIPFGLAETVNVMSTDFTIWGAVGERCCFQAWSIASIPV